MQNQLHLCGQLKDKRLYDRISCHFFKRTQNIFKLTSSHLFECGLRKVWLYCTFCRGQQSVARTLWLIVSHAFTLSIIFGESMACRILWRDFCNTICYFLCLTLDALCEVLHATLYALLYISRLYFTSEMEMIKPCRFFKWLCI